MWREPLLHFLVLAAALFALDHLFASAQRQQIVVDRQTAEFLIRQRQDLEQRKLTPGERKQTIDSFVEEEILYSEAYKRGLDRGDSRMRRNLILKMRGLLVGGLAAPTESELRAYFEAHRERYARPATRSLDHVFFSDSSGPPADLLAELRAGRDPATVGEARFDLPRSMAGMSRLLLVDTFGPETARSILDIDDDLWHGPFLSARGAHFVRIVERRPAQATTFEAVRRYLEADWSIVQSQEAIAVELDGIRDEYEIVVEDYGASAP